MVKTENIQYKTKNQGNQVEHLYSPTTKWPVLNLNYLMMDKNYSLDTSFLVRTLQKVKKEFGLKPIFLDPERKKRRRTYRGIGLTHTLESKNTRYEASSYFNSDGQFISTAHAQNILQKSNFNFESEIKINDVAPDLAEKIFDLFKMPVSKIRIMELAPSGVVAPHYDRPYYEEIRVHCVLETNSQVFWEVDGLVFQIPNNGQFYWFDTGKVHSVYNLGDTSRSVLSVHLDTSNFFKSVNELSSDQIENWITGSQV